MGLDFLTPDMLDSWVLKLCILGARTPWGSFLRMSRGGVFEFLKFDEIEYTRFLSTLVVSFEV